MNEITARYIGAIFSLLLGTFVFGGALYSMNQKVEKPKEVNRTVALDLDVNKKKKKPKPKPVKRPRAKPKPVKRARAPRPSLASNLSGLGGGVALFDAEGLSDMGDDLLGGDELTKDMVMTAEAVDQPPQRLSGPAPSYPSRARARGVEGLVVLRLLVSADGKVEKVSVVESNPEGVFEQAAIDAARQTRFQPATYQGQPVKMDIEWPVRFKLS